MEQGSLLYRVLDGTSGRSVTAFNPGLGSPTRFAFFTGAHGETIPVLYAALTAEAAIAESILRYVPVAGGELLRRDYEPMVLGGVRPLRALRLASFKGLGLRALGTDQTEVSETGPDRYEETVSWAKSAHLAGFDGVAWMSHRCNSDVAVMIFGDRVDAADLEQDDGVAKIFRRQVDREWLTDLCAGLHITVRW
ncbi:RES domain-containing protein [Citricoccus sp. NPDC055426]|uniref:RES domain-containing protein n=1 Tax=Citricoccus sp. NPDC055426 TaxID=3155536 RepID=UPI00343E09A8